MIETRRPAFTFLAAAFLTTGVLASTAPPTVSPGQSDRLGPVDSACPTFSWGDVEGESAYELAVLPVAQGAEGDDAAAPVLRLELPPGTSTWTPSSDRCLQPGGSYVWTVRAGFADPAAPGDDRWGDWSAGRYFAVRAVPSAEDVRAALATLESVAAAVATGPGPEGVEPELAPPIPSLGEAPVESRELRGEGVVAAIHAEIDDTAGPAYGLVGQTHSDEGAGAWLAGAAGGADLVLDGAADGLASTLVSQSGVFRSSENDLWFHFANVGSGELALRVGGEEVVTTATDRDVLGDLACAAGERAEWNGAEWECVANDADTLDGLDSTAFAPLAHVHDGRYFTETELGTDGAAEVHWGNLGSVPADLADGDDGADYQAGFGLQLEGTTFRLADGDLWVPRDNTVTSLDLDSGSGASITVGADGFPILSYRSAASDLRVYHCTALDCSSGSSFLVEDLFPASTSDEDTSIAIGIDGLPILSYRTDNGVFSTLWAYHCDSIDCSSGSAQLLDHPGGSDSVGRYSSLTIGSDGLPIISYWDDENGDLKVYHCAALDCSSGSAHSLDSTDGSVGLYTSIAIGVDGLPIISYLDWSPGIWDLKAFHCDDVDCSTGGTATTLDSAGTIGLHTSITIGRDGLPIISYYNSTSANVKVFHCDQVDCTSGSFLAVDIEGHVGRFTSITLDTDGMPMVAYADETNASVKIYRCSTVDCSSGIGRVLDTPRVSGFGQVALTIGSDGLPIVAYQTHDGALETIHCSDPTCIPFFRRR